MNLMTDEKHYVTMNNYCLSRFKKKTYRISLNGNFSCPNRDGTISTNGCIFCSEKGSGDFAGDADLPLVIQFENIKKMMEHKWPDGYFIAYFQANTNTYGPLSKLKDTFSKIITSNGPIDKKIKVLSIATRPDCLDNEKIAYLKELNKQVEVWVELGFQTSNEITSKYINRGYTNEVFVNAVKALQEANLYTVVHIINGLPNETKTDMLNTIKFVNSLNINAIKIHMLHVMKNTPLGTIYQKEPFPLLSLEEYTDIVVEQLRNLNSNIVVQRITGDAPKDLLLAPKWTLKKFVVMNEIDKALRKNNFWQGDLCSK